MFGIDEEVSMYSCKAAIALTPSIILYIGHTILEKLLMNQQIVYPEMVLQFANTFMCPIFCYIFVFLCDYGMYGVMITRAVLEFIYCIGLIYYIKYTHCSEKILKRPSLDMFTNWGSYLVIAIPSLVMTCFEWWAFVSHSTIQQSTIV